MVTTMPELLQPISWLLHACHGCYNQMCGCNNLKSNGCFNQETRLLLPCQFQGCFNQAGFLYGVMYDTNLKVTFLNI